jgi:protein O-GlcNAc transferase
MLMQTLNARPTNLPDQHLAAEGEPDQARLYFKIGRQQYAQQLFSHAAGNFARALSFKPNWDAAWRHYGFALMALAQHENALQSFQNSLLADRSRERLTTRPAVLLKEVTQPDDSMAVTTHMTWLNMGVCLERLGRTAEAADCYRQAVSLKPDYAAGWFNLAGVLQRHGSMQEVTACYHKTLEAKPDWDVARLNLAVALRKLEKLDQAIAQCRQSIQVNPGFIEARVYLLQLAQHACDWPLLAAMAAQVDRITCDELSQNRKTTESPLLNLRRHADPALNQRVACSWSRSIAAEISAQFDLPIFRHPPRQRQRIRIGYLSADFKDHAVAHQMRGVLARHDRSDFEIFVYACNPDDGTRYRRYLSEASDHFTDIHGLTDIQAARQIFNHQIDILVDLSGHSQGARTRIGALRPAPLQVNYLGFLGTSGADHVDYVLADRIVVPEHHRQWYTEKVVYLPHCYQANDDDLPISTRVFERCEHGLPQNAMVYCCFNQPYKIDAWLFEVWMDILRQSAGSVLWLLEQNQLARSHQCRAAERSGVDPKRLVFAGALSIELHLARLKLADLALDTRTYNGGATTANALWAGVPLLTMLGNHWVSRMSASALHAVGLSGLVARDLDDYRRLAITLASEPQHLKSWREALAARRLQAPLFNTGLFVRHLEKAYRTMWQRHLDGQPPAAFAVQPESTPL